MRRCPSIFQQMAPFLKRAAEGKIDTSSHGYTFGEEGYTNPQGVVFKPFPDDKGRLVQLYRRRSVRCPLVLDNGYPVVRGRASVPLTVCRKCPYHLPKTCCKILRDGVILVTPE